MGNLIFIVAIAFVMGAVVCVLGSQLGQHLFYQYRAFFIKRVNSELKQSFIFADASLLFMLTLAVVSVLTITGFIILGMFGAVLAGIIGLLMPAWTLKIIKRRRNERFVYQLPDALHSLSASLRSGVNLPKGLEQLAAWQPAPLSQEFGLVLTEYQIGRELGDALDNMQSRIQRPELELMNGAIMISRSVGGNLADTLETLAETLSEKMAVEGKIKALTAMGRMQGWVVSGIPLLMGVAIYLTNPEQIMPFFEDLRGWITLAIMALMMTMAVLMIRKIVNIDV